ncbi:MAG TPA: 16S rRNA (adenine(1518)-N(6)/adenine(1519)-N(6))-dimethyltransferase RsmA [Syntrophorhabdaceae bacterium]|nr:16S rRNA (adenine(1518)-N(6)/adenine(1519)-N(6))-dimethyltransferase RsmA [Syntrophorhabdaceae bacterium]
MLKKGLSQHLIKDRNILDKIVSLTSICRDDVVVEIGPGQGDLTHCIAERAGLVYAIEIDGSLKPYLDDVEKTYRNVKVIYDDFLDISLSQFIDNRKIKVIGNIPYKITGPILFKLIRERGVIKSAYLTVQKEIAERIVSTTHRRTYGALSVNLQILSDVRMLFTLKPTVFIPPPKVESALISIIFKEDELKIDEDLVEFVRLCFKHKRKYMKNSLSYRYGADRIAILYKYMGFSANIRAEEIEPHGFKKMYMFMNSKQNDLFIQGK